MKNKLQQLADKIILNISKSESEHEMQFYYNLGKLLDYISIKLFKIELNNN